MFTGKTVGHIEPGAAKYSLVFYGGDMDEETYWKKLRELDPAHGLRDHTPGSVLSERERMGLSAKKASQLPSKAGETVWDVCRRAVGAPPAESLENQSIALVSPTLGRESPPAGDARVAPAVSSRPDNVVLDGGLSSEARGDADDDAATVFGLPDVYDVYDEPADPPNSPRATKWPKIAR